MHLSGARCAKVKPHKNGVDLPLSKLVIRMKETLTKQSAELPPTKVELVTADASTIGTEIKRVDVSGSPTPKGPEAAIATEERENVAPPMTFTRLMALLALTMTFRRVFIIHIFCDRSNR